MDDKGSEASGSPLVTGFLLIVLIALGAIGTRDAPLHGARPRVPSADIYSRPADGSVAVRLWEDPIAAVANARRETETSFDPRNQVDPSGRRNLEGRPIRLNGNPPDHTAANLASQIAQRSCSAAGSVRIVGVMVDGDFSAESTESRRRARYATLAGLESMGFAPEHSTHLNFLLSDLSENPNGSELPEFIAYEWFEMADSSAAVLVMWLDESVFGTATLERLSRLRTAVRPPPCGGLARHGSSEPDLVVVGPGRSSTVKDMASTAPDSFPFTHWDRARPSDKPWTVQFAAQSYEVLPGLYGWPDFELSESREPTFYAYGATAADEQLLVRTPFSGSSLTMHDAFVRLGLQVFRTVATDEGLSSLLTIELRRRGAIEDDDCSATRLTRHANARHVVLISESDTTYGRALSKSIKNHIGPGPCGDPRPPVSIHEFTYLSGLDGEVPESLADSTPKTQSGIAREETAGISPVDPSVRQPIERPNGPSQLDYLRRVVAEILRLNQDLEHAGKGRVTAVGVIGSDIFDKLLILQALRPKFENLVFFSVDLDAWMLHPEQLNWTRNLVVASSFGLTLSPQLQQTIPPFRDTRETAIFLSTLIALQNTPRGCTGAPSPGVKCISQQKIDRWLSKPRLFEIGRTRYFDFSNSTSFECVDRKALSQCDAIHPRGSPMFSVPPKNVLLVPTLSLLLAAVAMTFGARMRGRYRGRSATSYQDLGGRGSSRLVAALSERWPALSEKMARLLASGAPRVARRVIATLAIAAAIGWFSPGFREIADYLTEHDDGSPIVMSEGISVWPVVAFQLVAFVVAILFAVDTIVSSDKNHRAILSRLKFNDSMSMVERLVRYDDEYLSIAQRFIRRLGYLRANYFGSAADLGERHMSLSAKFFWKNYLVRRSTLARVARVFLAVLLFMFAMNLVVMYLDPPVPFHRGAVAVFATTLTAALSGSAILFAGFFVLDEIRLCSSTIAHLYDDLVLDNDLPQETQTIWAEQTIGHYLRKFEVDERYLSLYILIDFIMLRTADVGKLIYFPFFVSSMVLLLRSRLFPSWAMPINLLIILVLIVSMVSVAAVVLRRQAERAREDIVRLLEDEVVRLSKSDPRGGANCDG